LIEAFRICHEKIPCKLVVAGIGCEKYREEYCIHDSAMDKDIVFLGWVEQEELVSLYNLAELVFFPSLYETFGIPVCEAISCGRPVVIAETGSLPEIAGEAGLVVDPQNPHEMAEALYSLWTSEPLRQIYMEKASARAKTFSWSRSAMETLEVLEAVGQGIEFTSRDPLPFVRSRLNEIRSGSSE
jgi:glycosyltransferase involved in cell wall biosynthesis